MTADIPNTFIQTEIENKLIGEQIIMGIREQLVDMLISISPEEYKIMFKKQENKVLYIEIKKALYIMHIVG